MDLKNILFMRKTGKPIPSADLPDIVFGLKLHERDYGGVVKTATGNPVSIVTNKAQNAISTLLSYSPRQSGSGDPSPINIRPIEGWTEANLGVNSETPTTTISLGGTYYGFTVDVERGVLRANIAITDLGSYEWTKWTKGDDVLYYNTISEKVNNRSNRIMCSALLAIDYNASGLDGANNNLTSDNSICSSMNTSVPRLMARCNSVSTGEDFKTAMSGVMLTYELNTPLEIPLTPQTVALLAGNNTIWTDGDEIELTYKAKRG